ncbi:MAG: type II secretion system protein [Candidatus Liptonbacteria bacterium]
MVTPTYGKCRGFTLIEVLIFTAIFSLMAIAFMTILVVVSRIQVREGAVAEVNQVSNYLMRTIENGVQGASLIDLPADTATTTLKLRMASSSADPTYIYLSNGTVYIKEMDSGIPQAISSQKVSVNTLAFTRRTNTNGRDTVSVSLDVSYNTSNIQQAFTQALLFGVRRASAAVFDSNLVPSMGNTYKLGAAQGDWQSINSTIYFSGGYVGIGVQNPSQKLELGGGMKFNPSGSAPTCDSSTRGTLWFVQSAPGADDILEVCMQNVSSSYVWRQIN